jgi:hypothetical protein
MGMGVARRGCCLLRRWMGMGSGLLGRFRLKQRRFFFEKKKQKTFIRFGFGFS